MSKQFAAMEEAAMKAYEEDLKRMEREAAGKCFCTLLKLYVTCGLCRRNFSLLTLDHFRVMFRFTTPTNKTHPAKTTTTTTT